MAEPSAAAGDRLAARFLPAQDQVYPQVLHELRSGAKRTHWMWFIFPQIAGLGHSDMAQRYALSGVAEAQDYLAHGVLAARLRGCTEAALLHGPDGAAPRSLAQLFGSPDDLKFHSSMTLFNRASPDDVFREALAAFWNGREDTNTLSRIDGGAEA